MIGKTVICVRIVAQPVVTWGTQKPDISNSALLRFRERNSGPGGGGAKAGRRLENTGRAQVLERPGNWRSN